MILSSLSLCLSHTHTHTGTHTRYTNTFGPLTGAERSSHNHLFFFVERQEKQWCDRPASLPMWKDSWEIIAAKPAPRLNKGPAVEQEVGSSAALCRQESSSLPERQSFGAGKSKLTLRQQSLQKAPEPPDRWRAIGESVKHRGKDVLLIDKECFVFFFGPNKSRGFP